MGEAKLKNRSRDKPTLSIKGKGNMSRSKVHSYSLSSKVKGSNSSRAKVWSEAVEEGYRLQQCGWKDLEDYSSVHGPPGRWHNGFIKMLRTKEEGFYTYWNIERECEDKLVSRVKLHS